MGRGPLNSDPATDVRLLGLSLGLGWAAGWAPQPLEVLEVLRVNRPYMAHFHAVKSPTDKQATHVSIGGLELGRRLGDGKQA